MLVTFADHSTIQLVIHSLPTTLQPPKCHICLVSTSDKFRPSWSSGPTHTRNSSGKVLVTEHHPSRHLAENLRYYQSWSWPLLSARTSLAHYSQLLCPNGGTEIQCCTWEHADTFAVRGPAKRRPQKAGLAFSSTKQVLQSEDIEKRRQGATLRDQPFDYERLRTLPVYLHHRLRVVVYHTNPNPELWLESGGLQNSRQEPMVNPIKGLGVI